MSGALTAFAVAGVSLAVTAASGDATPAPTSFTATTAADAVRLSVTLKEYLLVERIADAGGPSAQATLTALDTRAYAAYPWPGDETLAALDLAEARSGAMVPDYPLAVATSRTKPEAKRELGPISLSARSTETESTARAIAAIGASGFSAGRTDSVASIIRDRSSGMNAKATTLVEGVSVGDRLQIAAISSSAEVTAVPGEAPSRHSAIKLSGVTIAGQPVEFSDKGFTVAGTTTPLPPDGSVSKTLADAGITVTYLSSEATPEGVLSAGIRIRVVRTVPNLPAPLEIVLDIGRTSASIQIGDVVTDDGEVVADDAAALLRSSDGGPLDEVRFGAKLADDAAAPPPQVMPGEGRRVAESVGLFRHVALEVDSVALYLALVLSGLVLVGGSLLVRLLGVKR